MNLDSMTNEELVAFYNRVKRNPRKTARELFSDTPKGYITTTKDLAHYAINKATALDCGETSPDDKYTKICGFIKSKCLPEYACRFFGG